METFSVFSRLTIAAGVPKFFIGLKWRQFFNFPNQGWIVIAMDLCDPSQQKKVLGQCAQSALSGKAKDFQTKTRRQV